MSELSDMHKAAGELNSTDQLITHYALTTDLPVEVVEAIVKAGIDTLYEMRNADFTMHPAGAAAAVEAVLRYRRAVRHIPERMREGYDPEPYTDPHSGVTYPVSARDVLDPQEHAEYQRERRTR